MRQITTGEILTLREMLQMEIHALASAKAIHTTIGDEQLKSLSDAAVLAAEGRIRGLQQFVSENNITSIREVQ